MVEAKIPATRVGKKTVTQLQFDMVDRNPYQYTSDDVLFATQAIRNSFSPDDQLERENFFSKGRTCFRASALPKTHGWGIHFNEDGKMALYAINFGKYQSFIDDNSLKN